MGSHIRNISRSISKATLHGSEADLHKIAEDSDSQVDLHEHLNPLKLPDALATQRCTCRLGIVVVSVLLSAINFGYNTSVLNTPEDVIRRALGGEEGYVDDFSWAIIVSIFAIGGLMGSALAPPILDTVGRKRFMLYNGVFLMGALLFQSASVSVLMMVIARLLVGVSCGGTTVAVPLYLGEIAPLNLRGSLGTLNQFACVVGILLAQVLGQPLGGPGEWRLLLGIGAIFATAQIALSAWVVESPRWLVMHEKFQDAERILMSLRGNDSVFVHLELDSMHCATMTEQRSLSAGQLFRSEKLRFPFLIGIALQIFQQWSGINAVFYYSTGFFENANFANPYLGTVLCGAVNVVATGVAVDLMDRAGRRPLLILSAVGMTVSSLLLTGALLRSQVAPEQAALMGYIQVAGVLAYVAFFEFGLGPIPWAITAELFGGAERATAMGACSAVNWVGNFIVGMTFPSLNAALGALTFVPFAVVTAIAAVFSWRYVPETKGRTLVEIQKEMQVLASGYSPQRVMSDDGDVDAKQPMLAAATGYKTIPSYSSFGSRAQSRRSPSTLAPPLSRAEGARDNMAPYMVSRRGYRESRQAQAGAVPRSISPMMPTEIQEVSASSINGGTGF